MRGFLIRTACLAALCSALDLQALDPAKPLKEYNCQSWNYQNGLPVNAVNALAQSSDGYIWLGTPKGLLRFDGADFHVLGAGPWHDLRALSVLSLCASKEGGVWFAVERSAFAHYSAKTGWKRGEPKTGDMWAVNSLDEAPDGVLWTGGEYLKSRRGLNGETASIANHGVNSMLSLHADRKGRVWIGTANQGLYWLEAGKLNRVPDELLDKRIIFAITSDAQGNLWLGTHAGVLCLDTNLQRCEVALPQDEVRALCADREGALWLGTTGGGLWRWAGGRAEQFTKTDGLCDNRVLSLLEDREGSLWVGTRNGLNQFTDVKFPLVSDSQGVTAKPVLSVSPALDSSLWLATAYGIMKFDGWGHQYGADLTPPQPYTAYTKRVLESLCGDLYVLSGANSVRILSRGKTVAELATTNMPVALAEDSRSVVVSIGDALFWASREGLTPYEFKAGKAPELYWIVNLWSGRDGAFWVSSANGFARIKDGECQQWTQQDGLADGNVRWVMQDREGTVWIGTSTALSRLKDGKITNFLREDGLPDANIQAIVDDERGNLWVDSGIGLFRVSKRSLNAFANHEASHIDCIRHDGPESVKPMDRFEQESSGCRTPDGRIWFPRSGGALLINPDRVPDNRLAPPVWVQTARANGVEFDRTSDRRIPPGDGSLEFHFAALSYIATAQIRYRYQLEGYDAGWIDAGSRRQAVYANLKPGRYTFRVTACNADGLWNPSGDAMELVLLPHYYQAEWFYLICGLAVVGALGGTYGWRVRAERRKDRAAEEARRLLEAKVKERTTELEARREDLEREIEERKRAQDEIERVQEELLTASRLAGKAEVAANVLHNVGNVLNSVNVSAQFVSERIRQLRPDRLRQAAALLQTPPNATPPLPDTQARLAQYLDQFGQHLAELQSTLGKEIGDLTRNVDHIKQIVAMQQAHAKVAGVTEQVQLTELMEDTLRLCASGFRREAIMVERDYGSLAPVSTDRHKVLQILVNLLHNARHACAESSSPLRRVAIRIRPEGDKFVCVEVNDNGVGIPPENLTRIFAHGFTTRKDGNGFGLHGGALAAVELGGSLNAFSDGPGHGATFVLKLPRIHSPGNSGGGSSPHSSAGAGADSTR